MGGAEYKRKYQTADGFHNLLTVTTTLTRATDLVGRGGTHGCTVSSVRKLPRFNAAHVPLSERAAKVVAVKRLHRKPAGPRHLMVCRRLVEVPASSPLPSTCSACGSTPPRRRRSLAGRSRRRGCGRCRCRWSPPPCGAVPFPPARRPTGARRERAPPVADRSARLDTGHTADLAADPSAPGPRPTREEASGDHAGCAEPIVPDT